MQGCTMQRRFDGRLGHGVLDSAAAGRRMTLLVNWWTAKPQVGPHRSGSGAADWPWI